MKAIQEFRRAKIYYKKSSYLILTVCLLLFLIYPFILKLYDEKLEIFPAIIMPSGAGLVIKGNEMPKSANSFELYGIKNDSVQQINSKNFLGSIPLGYLTYIAESDFGLEPFFEEITLPFTSLKLHLHNRFIENNLDIAKSFYRKKLAQMGFNDSVFIYKKYIVKNDSVKTKIQVYEKSYILK